MEAKHTTGPWEVEYDEDDGEIKILMGSRIGHPGRYIAIHEITVADLIYEDDKEFGEAMANANIMAASPILYEALEQQLTQLQLISNMVDDDEAIAATIEASMQLVNNALRAARGEG